MSQENVIESIYTYDDEETFYIEGAIPFACTTNFYNRCDDFNINPELFIRQLMQQRVFLMSFDDRNTDYILILTNLAILSCALDEKNTFVITSLFEKNVRKQNKFIKSALKVHVTEPATFRSLKVPIPGMQNPDITATKFGQVKESFLQRLSTVTVRDSEYSEDEEYELTDQFNTLLTLVENYVTAEDEIQRSLAQSGPMISYYKMEATPDYDRVDKLAYRFYVSEIDEQVYNVGTLVQLHLENGDEQAGSIINLFKENDPFYITILFEEIFDVNLIASVGVISLQYNTVMREVRLNVIEDLQNGHTPARYLNKIIGEQSFGGFQDIDLSKVKERLAKQKYPPNQSQLDAIERGIKTNDMMLVLGPPGTGKTTVILEWVKYFVLEENLRVLVSSQNNKAVDNVLERLMEEKEIDTIRVGNEEKVQANVQHLMFEERAYQLQQQINEANVFYLEKISNIKSEIDKTIKLLDELIPLAQLLQVANLMIEKLYDELYVKYLHPLTELAKVDVEEKKKLIYLRKRYITAREYIIAYNKSEWFKKIYMLPKALYEMIIDTLMPRRHNPLFEKNNETVAQYNALTVEMTEFINKELSLVKESYQMLRNRWYQFVNEHKEIEITDIDGNVEKFSLEKISFEHAYTALKVVYKQLRDHYNKLDHIENVLIRWRSFLEEKKNYALTKILLESVDLVGATCIGINSQRRFQDLDFDVTIIDEAGQIQIHNVIVPMSRSPKTIMLGDHLQIPPIANPDVLERVEDAGVDSSFLQKSFFEFLYNEFPEKNKILLDTQYRMPAEIAELLSEWFYEGNYQSFAGKKGLPPLFPHLFDKPFVIVDTSKESNRFETQIPNQGYVNKVETEQVIKIIKKTIKEVNPDLDDENLLSLEDVGVITPYSQQVKYIREKLLETFPMLTKEMVQDSVASLDSFQGQERKMIIYSCTRSNRKNPKAPRIGFLKELRRLNVALSRCQEQLVFIGDIPFLSTCEYVETDDYGQQILDDFGNPMLGKSEKEFSEFIQLMVDYTKQGKAQYMYSIDI